MSDWKTLSINSIKGVHQGLLERREVYPISFIAKIRYAALHRKRDFAILEGFKVRINNHTLETFFKKSFACVSCGVVGKYFVLERHPLGLGNARRFKLSLYAVNDKNEEILMTRDHITPRSRGGKSTLSNHDCMCVVCNRKKSNRVEETSIDGQSNKIVLQG